MKNIPELSCAIVEDLLPTYVERLTSEETNMAVEAHLASCPACAAKRAAMGAKETEAAAKDAEETAREVDYLKKVRRRNRRRVWLAVACTTLVLAAVILTKIFIIGGPGQGGSPRGNCGWGHPVCQCGLPVCCQCLLRLGTG